MSLNSSVKNSFSFVCAQRKIGLNTSIAWIEGKDFMYGSMEHTDSQAHLNQPETRLAIHEVTESTPFQVQHASVISAFPTLAAIFLREGIGWNGRKTNLDEILSILLAENVIFNAAYFCFPNKKAIWIWFELRYFLNRVLDLRIATSRDKVLQQAHVRITVLAAFSTHNAKFTVP